MGQINITEEQCKVFPGGWSIKPDQMYVALSNVTYTDKLNVLEFGSGTGTHCLAQLLTDLKIPFNYVAYENDPVYVCNRPDVRTVLWTKWPEQLEPEVYDLVIIDGPAGKNRIKWYPLIKQVTRSGTILMIDDFRHFSEFLLALNLNFKHKVIREVTKPVSPYGGQISWLVTAVKKPHPRGRKRRK
jgi:hypothetical protein